MRDFDNPHYLYNKQKYSCMMIESPSIHAYDEKIFASK
jgi:hypothetical protein